MTKYCYSIAFLVGTSDSASDEMRKIQVCSQFLIVALILALIWPLLAHSRYVISVKMLTHSKYGMIAYIFRAEIKPS